MQTQPQASDPLSSPYMPGCSRSSAGLLSATPDLSRCYSTKTQNPPCSFLLCPARPDRGEVATSLLRRRNNPPVDSDAARPPAHGWSVLTSQLLETRDCSTAPEYKGRTVTGSQLTGSYGTFGGGERDRRKELRKIIGPDQQGAGAGLRRAKGPTWEVDRMTPGFLSLS